MSERTILLNDDGSYAEPISITPQDRLEPVYENRQTEDGTAYQKIVGLRIISPDPEP